MRKLQRVLLAASLLLFGNVLYSQTKTVSGTVTSSADRSGILGVTVTVKGTNRATQTKQDGTYSISAAPGDVLVMTSVGFSKREVAVGTSNVYNVVLSPASSELQEVTISQGIKRTSRSLGYSTQKVEGEELTVTNRDNFFTALQARVAGIMVTPTSGGPGSSAQIILRGPVSFDGSNQPLIVVDGLPISNKTISQGNLISDRPNRDNDYSNRGIDLNPEDIENVTILTGPEAAALYGTDGASGVILITTKKAKGGAPSVSYNTSLTVSAKPELPEIQQVYDQGSNGLLDNSIRSYFGPKYASNATLYDNRKAFFRNAFSQKHDLTFEGGTEKLSFRFSPSFARYNGTVPNSKLDKSSLRLSVSSAISTVLKLDASLNYINSINKKSSKGANSYYLSLLSWPSDDDIRVYQNANDGSRKKISSGAESDNPFWDVNKNINQDKTNRLLANVSLTYSPLNWLSITGRLGGDIYTTEGNRLYHPQSNSGIGTGGLVENYIDNTRVYNGSIVANIRKNFKNFTNNLSLGYNFDDNRTTINSYKGEKFLIPDYNSINNTDPATQRNLLNILMMKKFGYFGNLNVGYKSMLYLSLTGRIDASSNLLPNDPYFFYPGAGLSFVFSELMKNSSWLTFGKLKANVASTGKDPRRPYLTSDRLDPQLSFGGGLALNVVNGNADLKAEFTNTYELGTEMKFFDSRLGIDFTYYHIQTKDQITAPRISYGTGAVLKYYNSGEVRNNGVTVQLTGTPVKTKDLIWTSIINFAKNKNKVLKVPLGQKTLYLSDTWLYAGVRGEFDQGASISSLSSQGYLRNKDGMIIINPTTGLPVRDLAYTVRGDRAPDFNIGFVNRFSYKNFNLSFVVDARKGGDVFNGNALYMYVLGLNTRTLDREKPRVIEGVLQDGLENSGTPTKNTIVVIPYYNVGYYNSLYAEEEFIERDINWIKLQDVSLSYQVPSRIFQGSKIVKGLSVGLSAANLFIISNYSGIDPSVSGLNASAGGFGGTGIDYGILPSVKTFTFNLNVRF